MTCRMAGLHKCEKLNLYDHKVDEFLTHLTLASITEDYVPLEVPNTNSNMIEMPDVNLDNLSISEKKTCLTCNIDFEDRPAQVSHYSSDWHRFNIKQKLRGHASISESEFVDITDDISSISGSGSDSDDISRDSHNLPMENEEEDEISFHIEGIGRRHPRVFLRNQEVELFSVYRCVIYGKKNAPETVPDLLSIVKGLSKQLKWFIIMLAGGHFAAAIFDGDKIVRHKTLHRYVVRAKRGTAQSTHDSQGGHAKSVGAFMRRHHEAALFDDIKKVVEEWSSEIKFCHRIFLRATGSNRNTLFNGKNPILDKKDERIRLIPFPTRRPTFNEVKRAHSELSTIYCHGSESKFQDHVQINSSPKKVWEKKINSKIEIEREKIRQRSPEGNKEGKECDSSDEDFELAYSEHVTNTVDDLQPFQSTHKPNKKRRKKRNVTKKEDIATSDTEVNESNTNRVAETQEKLKDHFHGLTNELFITCKEGSAETLVNLLQNLKGRCDEETALEMTINQPISRNDGSTMLHLASKSGNISAVRTLLEAGSDPAVRDSSGQFVYVIAKDKETRNCFRRFMAEYPDKYNYSVAQIPSPLTKEMEDEKRAKEAEKRKQQKKIKKEKQKVRKEEERIVKKEESEKQRFLNLSDREKRALAAEKRLVSQLHNEEKAVPLLRRCFTCGIDITGKVPFEYNDNIFCTTKCLQAHRKSASSRT